MRSKFKPSRPLPIGNIIKFLFIAGVIVGVSFWGYRAANNFLFKSDIFTINRIDIYGLENITKSEILALVPFRPGDNMFKVWLSTVEKSLEKNRPELKNVSISRRWKAIRISLEERKPLGFLVVNNQKLGLDHDNKPFALRGHWASEPETKLPLILAQDVPSREQIIEFIESLRKTDEGLYKKLEFLNVEALDSIVLKIRGGYKVILGPLEKNTLKKKLNKLFQIQEDSEKRFLKIEYINLSYFDDGRIVVKPLKQ